MTTSLNMRLARFCAATLLSGFALLAGAQQQMPDPAGMSPSPMPKDARTRAKAHTELGAL